MKVTTKVQEVVQSSQEVLRGETDQKYLPLFPAMIFLLGFLFLPLLYLFFLSLMTYDPIELIVYEFTVENYQRLIGDSFYRQFIIYTLRVALITTGVCIVLGYPVGYYLSQTTPNRRRVLLFLVLLPLMVGTVVRTYGWMVILGANGILPQFIEALTGSSQSLLGTTTAVIIGLVGVLLPFLIVPVYSSLESIDESLGAAARNLGANKFQAFYRVTFPLSLPGVVSGSIFVFTLSMSAVVTPKLLGGRTDLTIGALMYDVALADANWPFASSMAIIMAVITFTLIFVYLKTSREKMEMVQ